MYDFSVWYVSFLEQVFFFLFFFYGNKIGIIKKQSSGGVQWKRCSEKFRNIYAGLQLHYKGKFFYILWFFVYDMFICVCLKFFRYFFIIFHGFKCYNDWCATNIVKEILTKWDALRDFIQFVKFKRHEKHLRKIATLLKRTLLRGCFRVFWIVQMVPNRAKHHKCTLSGSQKH